LGVTVYRENSEKKLRNNLIRRVIIGKSHFSRIWAKTRDGGDDYKKTILWRLLHHFL
jgi:hypothetical protein